MLMVLLNELENPESRDVACDIVPSVESSSEYLCRLSKLGTVRIVEFMRFGVRGLREDAGACGMVLLLAPLVVTRDMAELIVPSEAGVRVDRGEGRSCEGFDAGLGAGLCGVVLAGAVSVWMTVTDGRPWTCTVSLDSLYRASALLKHLDGLWTVQWLRLQRGIAGVRRSTTLSMDMDMDMLTSRSRDSASRTETRGR
jgi:hypothetical protein